MGEGGCEVYTSLRLSVRYSGAGLNINGAQDAIMWEGCGLQICNQVFGVSDVRFDFHNVAVGRSDAVVAVKVLLFCTFCISSIIILV